MTLPAPDRSKVKEFFAWEWPTRSPDAMKWGWGLAAVGVLTLGLGVGFVLIIIGGILLYYYYRKVDLSAAPVGRNIGHVMNAKLHDLTKIWFRSYFKIDKLIGQLRRFDLSDYEPLDGSRVDFASLTQSQTTLADIKERSVFIFGPPEHAQMQIGVRDGIVTLEYTPIDVSALYITGNQLVVYHAVADIKTGDLLSESIQRIYLNEIVQVSVRTSSDRIKVSENEGLIRKFNRARSAEANELVRSSTVIYLSKTDGGTIDFPTGTPTIKDGSKGALDSDEFSENREMRIATALQQNIESAKRLVAS